jgi:hypothetical protein
MAYLVTTPMISEGCGGRYRRHPISDIEKATPAEIAKALNVPAGGASA